MIDSGIRESLEAQSQSASIKHDQMFLFLYYYIRSRFVGAHPVRVPLILAEVGRLTMWAPRLFFLFFLKSVCAPH